MAEDARLIARFTNLARVELSERRRKLTHDSLPASTKLINQESSARCVNCSGSRLLPRFIMPIPCSDSYSLISR